jgi:hypothetical protein
LFWVLPWVGALVMWWDDRLDGTSLSAGIRTAIPEVRSPAAEDRTQQPPVPSRRPKAQCPRFFLVSFLVCSVASSCVGLYFRSHYFITLLPALALLTGVAISRALHLLKHDQTIELFVAIGILGLFIVAVGAALVGHGAIWLGLSGSEAARNVFASTLFTQTARAAEYVKSHASKGARVAVLGSEPQVYFVAGHRSASGHIYMYPLMENHPYALTMQDELIGEIERARPEYVLYIDDELSWLPRGDSQQRIAAWWKEYWARNLDLILTLKIEEGRESDTTVKRPAKDAGPEKHILVFKRRQ